MKCFYIIFGFAGNYSICDRDIIIYRKVKEEMSSYSYLFKFIVIGDTSIFVLMCRRRKILYLAAVLGEEV